MWEDYAILSQSIHQSDNCARKLEVGVGHEKDMMSFAWDKLKLRYSGISSN